MTEGLSDRAEDLFHQAADLSAEEQRALLDAACAEEPTLRAEVEQLLADDARLRAEDAATFLQSPLVRDEGSSTDPPGADGTPAVPPRVGRYRVVRLLGEGGMGTVYEAEQDHPRRPVALKVIRPGLVSPASVKRFAREAQILGRLQHPGIAQVHEGGVAEDGRPFFAMEFIRGVALDEYARRHGLDAAGRLDLLARVCDAVQHAHDRGIIHRDLKPSNILVDDAGQPRVLDFGVARAADPGVMTSASVTGTGQLVGTLGYMSPEQVVTDADSLDARSDVYSLGVILYRLLAGRPPYSLEGLPLPEVARVIREQEPPRLGSLDARLRGDVETIAARALEKDRARRYPSAAELAADVRRHLSGEPIRARRVGPAERLWSWARRRPALATAYALAGLVLFLGLGGALAVWAWQTAEGLRQAAEGARGEADRARQAEAAAKETLDQVLYLHRVQLAHRAWLTNEVARARQLLDECPPERRQWEWHYVKRLTRPLLELTERPGGTTGVRASPVSARFSPDGRRLVSMAPDGAVVVWDAETGQAVTVLEGSAPPRFAPGQALVAGRPTRFDVAFGPDGKVIASTRGNSVVVWDAETGKQLRVLSHRKVETVGCLAFTPDGQRLALGAGWSFDTDPRLQVWDAETSREVFVLQGHKSNVTAVVFSDDGRWLASGSFDRTARLWDATTGQEKFTLEGHADEVLGVAFHPDGDRLATASKDGTVKVWGVDGKLLLTLSAAVPLYSVAYSPDGKRLAAGLENGEIMLWDAAGKELFRLRGHLGPSPVVSGLSFGPDGKRLASAGWDETVRVWDATSSQEVRSIPLPLVATASVKLSRDGRRLAEYRHTGAVLVWEVGEQPRSVTLGGKDSFVTVMAFSPDESRLATVGAEFTLRLWDTRTGAALKEWKPHEERTAAVAFSPDGRLLATGGQSQGRGEVKVWDGEGRLLLSASDHAPYVASVEFSPDQRWLLSGDVKETLRVRDARTGEVRWETRGPSLAATFSPDGRWVAASHGTMVRVSDAATGEQRHALNVSDNGVGGVRFSPDGRRLVTTGREGTLILWDVTTGVEALRLRGASGEVCFSPDGSRLLSAGSSPAQAVKVWEAAPAAGP